MTHPPDTKYLPDERIVDVAPRFSPRVGDPHVRRLNFVPGRSLTADALNQERAFWDTQTALLGRALNPGIVDGLALELLDDSPGSAAIRLMAGRGITDRGQDVSLPNSMTVRLAEIPASEPLIEKTAQPAGLVGLFLKPVRAVSANFFDPEDPCPVDPEAYAYNDLVTQDAVQLVWAGLDSGLPASQPPDGDLVRPVRPLGGDPDDRAVLGRLSSTNILVPPETILGETDEKLIPTSIYRGIVADRLIREEQSARRRGLRPPWSEHGLPVGIVQLAADGRVLFADRFAITRAGGAVRDASGSNIGTATSLRRARFDQFLDHLQGLRSEGAELAPATQFFRELPPVGVLPAALLDRETLTCGFFPHNYAIEAAPIQLAQMESVLARRADLAPFDLARRDYVQILVPVPDHLFDPRLLIQEEISDDFVLAIKRAELREAKYKAELAELNAVEAYVSAAVNIADASGKTSVSVSAESAAASFRASAVKVFTRLEESFNTVPLSQDEQAQLSAAAFGKAAETIAKGEKPENGFLGLKPVAERLARRLDKGNDHADMGFLRLQSDIFRLRKQMVGESDATRLATSPVLANLASTTTGLESSKLFSKIVHEAPRPKSQLQLTASAIPQMAFIAMPMTVAGTVQPVSSTGSVAGDFVRGTMAARYEPAKSYTNLFAKSFGKTMSPIAPVTPERTTKNPTKFAEMGLAGIKANLQNSIVQAGDIAWHSLIYGKSSPIRTATIAERLRISPAQEAKNSSVATKAEIIRGIQELDLNLEGLLLPVSASRVTLIPIAARDAEIAELAKRGTATAAVRKILSDEKAMPVDGNACVLSDKHLLKVTVLEYPHDGDKAAVNKAIYKEMEGAASRLYKHRLGLDHANLAGLILADRLDPDPDDPDEAAFFAAAVDALESAVSMLRLFEGRVQSYSAFLDLLRKALVEVIDLSEKWQGAIDDVDAEISEAVHDRAVAGALMAEELARLEAINAKRRDILDKHVDIIAFARPTTVDRLRTAPGLKLFRPLEEVLAPCMDSDEDLPDEIEEILEAMNDAPIGWYPDMAKHLDRVRRPAHFLLAWQRGLDRANLWLARNSEIAPRIAYSGTRERVAGKASTGVYQALSGLLAQRKSVLQTRTRRSMESLQGVSWSSLRQSALDELSIEDLEQGGKAGREAARAGVRMLAQIGAVANCFLAGLREVPAELRLLWADQLSEHDKAIDLVSVNAIPGWSSIPLAERRELAVMHGWLFARIDQHNEQARAMMSTLVRVCLLLSSHAPVSSIVEGAVVETKNIGPGESFEVDIGLGRPTIGMIATIGSGKFRNRGVIEDIVGTRVRVRMTEANGPRIALAAREPIAFAAPVSIRLADTRAL